MTTRGMRRAGFLAESTALLHRASSPSDLRAQPGRYDFSMEEPVVVLGASAGGIEALSTIVAGLPEDLGAAVFVVLHIPAHAPSRLHEILAPRSRLPVAAARDGEPVRPGRIVVAVADRHLMLDEGAVRLTRGPKESRVRPSIDVLFRSAAAAYGRRAVGVVLSGTLDDGTAGLWAIKDRGGAALVQSPETSGHPWMPESAIRYVDVDAVVAIDDMAAEIVARVRTAAALPIGEEAPMPERMKVENLIAREGNGMRAGSLELGDKTAYTCPECHGALVEIKEGRLVRFRCHTGHAFTIKSLLADVTDAIDTSLWDTLRAIEERILILRQIEEMAKDEGAIGQAKAAGERAKAADDRVEALRRLLLDGTLFEHVTDP